MIMILFAIAAAIVAWLVIPARKSNGPPNPPEAMPPVFNWPSGPQPGPFQASVEEKMAVVESELRSRQADKSRKSVIDEVDAANKG